jgi:hypothetical protein
LYINTPATTPTATTAANEILNAPRPNAASKPINPRTTEYPGLNAPANAHVKKNKRVTIKPSAPNNADALAENEPLSNNNSSLKCAENA